LLCEYSFSIFIPLYDALFAEIITSFDIPSPAALYQAKGFVSIVSKQYFYGLDEER